MEGDGDVEGVEACVGEDDWSEACSFDVEDAEGDAEGEECGDGVGWDDGDVCGGEDGRGEEHSGEGIGGHAEEGGLEEVSVDDLFDDWGAEDGGEHDDSNPGVARIVNDALEGFVCDGVWGAA